MAPSAKTGLVLCIVVLMSSIEAYASYGRMGSQDSFFSDLESALATQTAGSCHLSGALEVCQAARVDKGDKSDFFHICPSDGDPCNPKLCYYTTIRPCCPNSPLFQCNSTSDLLVHGQKINVKFYDVVRPGIENIVCFTVNSTLEACDCESECTTTSCVENTRECNADGVCVCEPNYQPPDCCNCVESNSTHIIYKDPITMECKPICRLNCRVQLPNGPCQLCSGGYLLPDCCNCPPGLEEVNGVCKCRNNTDSTTGECKDGYLAPDCCQCDTTGNSTHVFYRNDNDECLPICRQKCSDRSPNGACRACSGGYLLPDCCNCPPGLEDVNGVCKCRNNTDSTTGECKDGYLAPDCCQCDTTGNSTHVFYRNDNDECLPICRQKCSDRAPNGACRVCSGGYLLPECCNCPPGLEDVGTGVCKCRNNTDSTTGECKDGYLAPDCCQCDTTGNSTHVFYRNDNDECLPICRQKCSDRAPNGACRACSGGYLLPDCCNCPPGQEDVDGVCKCKSNTDSTTGECKEGYLAPDCCECDTTGNDTVAFYKDNDMCIPYCYTNCDTVTSDGKGCGTCKEDYGPPPACCERIACNKAQSVYFLIDATSSNPQNLFCQVLITVDLLVAAFNPTPSGTTKVFGYLFPDGQLIWNPATSCVDIVKQRLPLLMQEFRKRTCSPSSTVFPGICGDQTVAVRGLEVIEGEVRKTDVEQAVVILTDGNLQDDPSTVPPIIQSLEKEGVIASIVAGLEGASSIDINVLQKYTIGGDANAFVRDDPIELGITIVNRLNAAGVLCNEHATNITNLFNTRLRTIFSDPSRFCLCFASPSCNDITYPTCGGPLDIVYPTTRRSNLEETIIAAVEDVLEQYTHG